MTALRNIGAIVEKEWRHYFGSPIAYVVRDNAGFVVGIDIGGTNIRAGAADVFGEMIHDEQEPTTKGGGRALAAQLAGVAARAVERGRSTHDRLLAIGISTPGVVDRAITQHVHKGFGGENSLIGGRTAQLLNRH